MITKSGIMTGNQLNETLANFITGGSVSIENGVASNFSNTSYINLNTTFSVNSTVEYHIGGLIPATTRVTANWEVYFGSSNANKYKLGLQKSTFKFSFWNGSSWVVSDTVAQTGTSYDVKLTWDKATYKMYYKLTSSDTWTQLTSFNATDTCLTSNLFIGRNYSNQPEFWSGSIDLSRTYIKVDDKVIYTPALITGLSEYQTVSKVFYEI
jgi:hypothetical protein